MTIVGGGSEQAEVLGKIRSPARTLLSAVAVLALLASVPAQAAEPGEDFILCPEGTIVLDADPNKNQRILNSAISHARDEFGKAYEHEWNKERKRYKENDSRPVLTKEMVDEMNAATHSLSDQHMPAINDIRNKRDERKIQHEREVAKMQRRDPNGVERLNNLYALQFERSKADEKILIDELTAETTKKVKEIKTHYLDQIVDRSAEHQLRLKELRSEQKRLDDTLKGLTVAEVFNARAEGRLGYLLPDCR